jgi:RND family efflux transporter MFP subunit
MKNRLVVILLALVLAGMAAWWLWSQRGSQVSRVSPTRGTAVEIVYGTGSVEPIRWAKVASLLRDRIVEVCGCEGKAVRQGDMLVRLDDREARAQLLELRAREDFAKRELARVSELSARGAATTQAYERASTDLRTIQGLISVLMEKLADYTIVAPMDGLVLRQDGEVGEIAEQGQVLVRVGVPRPLHIRTEINEEDIPRIAVGQKVLLRTDAFVNYRLEGKVRDITPMGDPVAKTYRVFIALPDDTPLKPGMSVEANVITREKPDALLVPADAVRGNAVYVLDGTLVRQRNVEFGIRGARSVEILSGLLDTDAIAVPAAELTDGGRVRVLPLKTP